MRKKLGEVLIEQGLLTQEQLGEALIQKERWGMRLGNAVVAQGYVSERDLATALGRVVGVSVENLSSVRIPEGILNMVTPEFVAKHELVPLRLERRSGRQGLVVAMVDPLNVEAVDQLQFVTGHAIWPVLATISDLAACLERHYPSVASETRAKAAALASVRPGDAVSAFHDNSHIAILPPDAPPSTSSALDEALGISMLGGGPATPAPAPTRSEPFDARSMGGLLPTLSGPRDTLVRVQAIERLLLRKGLLTEKEILEEIESIESF